MKNDKNIQTFIEKEQTRLKALEIKRDELEEKIKRCKASITGQILALNSQRYEILSEALVEAGVGFNEIIAALYSDGGLAALAEKVDAAAPAESAGKE